ncbi:MAG: choice-of-anchor D domain-containing protein [Burkholderiales bacterium]
MKFAIFATGLVAAVGLAAAGDARPGSAGGAGTLAIYADLDAFLAATAGVSLAFEDFSAHDAHNVSPCYEPVNRQAGQPATSFLEPECFHPGDVVAGFSMRSDLDWTSGLANVWGPMVGPGLFFVGALAMNPPEASNLVGAAYSAATRTLVDFSARPTAIAMDVYDIAVGSPLTIDVFAADGTMIGNFTVQPGAPNLPTFSGFTSSVPVARVAVHSASAVSQLVGNLRFGGGPARLVADALRADLGAVGIGDSTTQTVRFSNEGTLDVAIDPIAAPPAPFTLDADSCSGAALPAGASCALTVAFAPDLERSFGAALSVSSNDPDTPVMTIALAGHGVLPMLSELPSSLDFGNVAVGDSAGPLPATLANRTAAVVHVTAIGAVAAPFAASGGDCAAPPFDLASGQSCTLAFSFAPVQAGAWSGHVVIASSDPGSPREIRLLGRAGDTIFADGFEP